MEGRGSTLVAKCVTEGVGHAREGSTVVSGVMKIIRGLGKGLASQYPAAKSTAFQLWALCSVNANKGNDATLRDVISLFATTLCGCVPRTDNENDNESDNTH